MANRIIAVDLGAWSVKVAIAQPGLRHASLAAFVDEAVEYDARPNVRRMLGKEELTRLGNEGAAMALDDLIAYALESPTAVSAEAAGRAQAAGPAAPAGPAEPEPPGD